jgi:hypothetical protein
MTRFHHKFDIISKFSLKGKLKAAFFFLAKIRPDLTWSG